MLVVKDSSAAGLGGVRSPGASGGNVFGAYLTDPPHPASHYYGTGECFLWRASVLHPVPFRQERTTTTTTNDSGREAMTTSAGSRAVGQPPLIEINNDLLELAGLPLPPSADTTHVRGRSTTLRGEEQSNDDDSNYNGGTFSKLYESPSRIGDGPDSTANTTKRRDGDGSRSGYGGHLSPTQRSASHDDTNDRGNGGFGDGGQDSPTNLSIGASRSGSGTTTPERIRFKAFPYSGVNDYMILCETGFLSVGGG